MSQDVLSTETNRRQLQQIIAGLSDGVILLDPDQSILWANEAALAMHGVSQVSDLGATAAAYAKRFALRYRNKHGLAVDSYPISRVARGETFSDVLVEVTPAADQARTWVHRVRSLVLADSRGDPESLVLIMDDVTDWASAEQRFEKTFTANPAPAVICRLSDLRYIKVNPGFLEMTGYSREQVIGTSTYELDVLDQAEHKELARQRLCEGATIPQMQAELRLADGGRKQVIVAGQPLELNDEACMLFSFVDMEPRHKAEIALRQSEERFAKAFACRRCRYWYAARRISWCWMSTKPSLIPWVIPVKRCVGSALRRSTSSKTGTHASSCSPPWRKPAAWTASMCVCVEKTPG